MDAVNFLNLEYVFLRIFDFFKNLDIVAILNAVIHFIEVIRPYAIIITLILFGIIIYSMYKMRKIEEVEHEKFEAQFRKEAEETPHDDPELAERWRLVQTHVNSDNPSDWRLAILEADIMLGDVLDKLGYQGDSIGDKLKSVDKSDFLTIDQAWEAHRVRNQIAHEGSDFRIDQREAKRVVGLFQKVFEEFYHI